MQELFMHIRGHKYEKGLCLTCGYHCVTCPPGKAVCKCTPYEKKPPHIFTDTCGNKWCAIHWYYNFELKRKDRYPEDFNIKTSRRGWVRVTVYCGPGAFLPKKV